MPIQNRPADRMYELGILVAPKVFEILAILVLHPQTTSDIFNNPGYFHPRYSLLVNQLQQHAALELTSERVLYSAPERLGQSLRTIELVDEIVLPVVDLVPDFLRRYQSHLVFCRPPNTVNRLVANVNPEIVAVIVVAANVP